MRRMGRMGPIERMPAPPPSISISSSISISLLPSTLRHSWRPAPEPSAHPRRPPITRHGPRMTRLFPAPETITLPLYLGDRTFRVPYFACKLLPERDFRPRICTCPPRSAILAAPAREALRHASFGLLWLDTALASRGARADRHGLPGAAPVPRAKHASRASKAASEPPHSMIHRAPAPRPILRAPSWTGGFRISCPCRPRSPLRPFFRPLRGSSASFALRPLDSPRPSDHASRITHHLLDLDLLFPSVQAARQRPLPAPSAHPRRRSCHASRVTRHACIPRTPRPHSTSLRAPCATPRP